MPIWPGNHERFKDIAATIQSLVLTVGVIAGGIWTWRTFTVLREVQQASLKSQQLELDVADHARKAANGLGIDIEAHQQPTEGYAVSALIKITNRSTQHRAIDFRDAPLHVWRINFDPKTGNSTQEEVLNQDNLNAESRTVRSGETVDYLYFFKVSQKGLYLLSMLIPLTPEEYKIHLESGGPKGDISWDGTTYVVVR